MIFGLLATPAAALTPPKIMVSVSGDSYHMSLKLTLKAPLKRVWNILTDYARIKRLNPNVSQSKLIYRDGQTLLRIRTKSCVLFICFPITQTESLTTSPFTEIQGVVIPRLSSFRSGVSRWRLYPIKGGTRVDFDAVRVPAFYVPPVLGSWIIIRKLTAEMRETAKRLTALAIAKSPHKAKIGQRAGARNATAS